MLVLEFIQSIPSSDSDIHLNKNKKITWIPFPSDAYGTNYTNHLTLKQAHFLTYNITMVTMVTKKPTQTETITTVLVILQTESTMAGRQQGKS